MLSGQRAPTICPDQALGLKTLHNKAEPRELTAREAKSFTNSLHREVTALHALFLFGPAYVAVMIPDANKHAAFGLRIMQESNTRSCFCCLYLWHKMIFSMNVIVGYAANMWCHVATTSIGSIGKRSRIGTSDSLVRLVATTLCVLVFPYRTSTFEDAGTDETSGSRNKSTKSDQDMRLPGFSKVRRG